MEILAVLFCFWVVLLFSLYTIGANQQDSTIPPPRKADDKEANQ